MAESRTGNRVFVVFGRNGAARSAMYGFLRRIGLSPVEWDQAVAATGKASPYVGEILKAAFEISQAVVVLMTPDEVAYLRTEYAETPEETEPGTQARPNVLFEAGMALGLHEDRTVIVELGRFRPVSDYAGRHAVRNITQPAGLKALAERLRTAGCPVDLSGTDWLEASQFQEPPSPSGDYPLGKRVVAADAARRRDPVDVRWHSRGNGNGSLEVLNHSGQALLDLNVEAPQEDDEIRGALHIAGHLPVPKLPAGKSVTVAAFTLGGLSNAMVTVTAVAQDGSPVREEVFVDLGR